MLPITPSGKIRNPRKPHREELGVEQTNSRPWSRQLYGKIQNVNSQGENIYGILINSGGAGVALA